jgi:hypothetical protein
MEAANSPLAYRAPLAFDAVLPRVVMTNNLPASLVPQKAATELCSSILDNRCGVRDEEDLSESFTEEGSPASSPVPFMMEVRYSDANGPSLDWLSLGMDGSQKPTGPINNNEMVHFNETSAVAAFPHAPESFIRHDVEASPTQVSPEGMGGSLVGLAALTVPSLPECALDAWWPTSPLAQASTVEIPHG